MFYHNLLSDEDFKVWLELVRAMNIEKHIHFVHYFVHHSDQAGNYIRRIVVNGTDLIVTCGKNKNDLVFEVMLPAFIYEGKIFDAGKGKYEHVKLRYPISTQSVNKLLKLVEFAKIIKQENLKAVEEFKKSKSDWRQKRDYLENTFGITKSDRECFAIYEPFYADGLLNEDGKVNLKMTGLPFEVACKILKILKGK